MPVTHEQITELRAQLAADRELCKGSDLAQKYLDSAETKLDEAEESWARCNPVEALDAVLDSVTVGTDDANLDELRAMAADLREWEAALEDVSANRTLPLYLMAEKYLLKLKRNYVALYWKNKAETLPTEDNSTVN